MKRLTVLLLLLTTPCLAADWYVDATNEGGTEDGSESNPYGTIAEAITASSSGDTVYVKASATYSEDVAFGGKNLTLIGYDSVITDNGRATIDGTTWGINFTPSAHDEFKIAKNFTVLSTSWAGVGTGSTSYRNSAYLENVVVDGNPRAFYFYGGSDGLYMKNCVAADASTTGVLGNGVGLVAVNCAVINCGTGFSSGRLSAYGCIAIKNTGNGFSQTRTDIYVAPLMVNCVADGNTGSGFSLSAQTSGIVSRCIAIRNGAYGFTGATANHVITDCYIGSDSFANTSGTVNSTYITSLNEQSLSSDPFTAIWTTTTNETWEGQDYRVTTSSGMFDVLTPVGDVEGLMQAYTSIGPKVQNVAGGSGAIIIAPRRHGN